jgi:IS4 transposase
MRVDDTGFAEVARFKRSGGAETVVNLAPLSVADADDYECPRAAMQVRLVSVITPTGRAHILMTSLLNSTDYPAADFGDLYHARWRIEEAFKRIKHRLALEHLTGISWLAAQ